jgi:hypothetical protein
MSYHILHQFDEQWFADNGADNDAQPRRLFGSLDGQRRQEQRQAGFKPAPQRQWLVVITALMIAASALYFALDARRHANELQQRLSEIETTMKK